MISERIDVRLADVKARPADATAMALDVIDDHALDCSNPASGMPRAPDADVAGDWGAFKQRCAFLDATLALPVTQNLDAKRQYALDYLGDRAQLRGGVFRSTKPTVFTETMVTALGKRNATARFTRYPWLAQMIALISALDDAQYNVVNQDRNVLSFPDNYASRNATP